MISTLTTLPYRAARLPLTVLDLGLSRTLPESSFPRLAVGRTIGTTDRLAGRLLHDRSLATRGTQRIEQVDTLVESARLEAEAAVKRQVAEDEAEAGRREAAAKRAAANERAEAGFTEAEQAEQRAKKQAAAKAKKAAAAKKAQADEVAEKRTETVAERKQAVADRAEAKKKAARDEASADLADARESKKAASDAKADAEVLGDLAAAKKSERKQD